MPLLNVNGVRHEHGNKSVAASSHTLMSTEAGGITTQYVEPSDTAFQAQAEGLAHDAASVPEIALRRVRPQSAVWEVHRIQGHPPDVVTAFEDATRKTVVKPVLHFADDGEER